MDLPAEIFLKIFSYLDHEDLSVVCMSVCRHWLTIAQDPSFWREIKFQNYFSEGMIEAYLQLPFIWKVVTTLEIVEGQEIPNLPIPNLLTLAIPRLSNAKDSERINQFPSLTTLQIKSELDHDCVLKLHSSEILQQKFRLEIDALHVRVEEDIANARNTLTAVRNLTSTCTVENVRVQLNMYEESLKRQDVLQEVLELIPKTQFIETPNFIVLKEFSVLTHVYLFSVTRVQAFQVLPATCPNLRYCKLGLVSDGAMPAVSPVANLEELHLMDTYMPEDELFEVLTVWKSLKGLSVKFTTGIESKLDTISRENPDLLKLYVSTPCNRGDPWMFHGTVTFPALKTLEFTEYSGYQVLGYIFTPVLSTLTVPDAAGGSTLDLYRVCPSVECVHLQPDTLKVGIELLKPISQSLRVVRAPEGRVFPHCLPEVKDLVDMCSELTELYLRVEPVDLKSFFEELQCILTRLKKLRTLRLWVMFMACQNQEFYDAQVLLTDQILRNCFRSGSITWEVGRHEVIINFVPQALRRKLAFHGFLESESAD